MSRVLTRGITVFSLVLVSAVFAHSQPPNPTALIGNPVPGPQAGTVGVTGSWVKCNGIDSVTITVSSKSPQGVVRIPKTVFLKPPPALLPDGNWPTIVTGLTTGDIVFGVQIEILPPLPPGGGKQKSIASDAKVTNLVVP
jgi:hypothetical protein